jgi:membrane protein
MSILITAVKRFDQHDGDMRAAAIAYYSLISLFPLILLLIVGLSYVLETERAQARVVQLLIDANVPTSLDIVSQSIQPILRARAAISAVALVSFAWSGLAVFSTIERAMNRIWDVAVLRPYWRGKLMALLGIIAIGAMTVLSVTTTAGVTYIKNVILPFVASHTEVNVGPWEVLVVVTPYVGSILLFMVVYRIFPNTTLSWRDVWPGSLLAGLLWEQAKRLFGIYLTAFNRNSFVYGSVGTIIATMIWFYVTAMILLIGAEISAAYTHKRHAIREAIGQP